MPAYSSREYTGPSDAEVAFSAGVDIYEILGVTEDADAAEVKKHFFDCARKFHPDRLPDDMPADERERAVRMFKNSHTAYEILSSPALRAEYDGYVAGRRRATSVRGKAVPRRSTAIRRWLSARVIPVLMNPSDPKLASHVELAISTIWITLEDVHAGAEIPLSADGGSVTVEAGARTGTRYLVSGVGILVLRLIPHAVFRRGGTVFDPQSTPSDLFTTVRIDAGTPASGIITDLSGRRVIWNSGADDHIVRLPKRGIAGAGDVFLHVVRISPSTVKMIHA